MKLPPDEFVGASQVVGLHADTFMPFLKTKDVALVMFYADGCPDCEFSRKHFKKAAKSTKRPNHAYAAVSCEDSASVCCGENITGTPYYKLYSRGKEVGFIDHPRLFPYKDMRHWVEHVNVFNEMGAKIDNPND